ncbi:MAG: SPOR domain-containing protein [Legionellaceae bacterium]|nr:SPOR domain-containing protein [Legionellaceae bacterium]
MAKNYGKKTMGRRNGSGVGSLMLAFVAFVFGYLIATVFDMNQLSGWVNTHVFAQQTVQSPEKPASQQAQLPKPKFEFYTLLAKEQVGRPLPQAPVAQTAQAIQPTADPVHVASSRPSSTAPLDLTVTQKLPLHEPLVAVQQDNKPTAVAANTTDKFMVQVGSFKNLREAEKMKASLVMKGFDVTISSTNQQQISWYRVIIGPFDSRTQAQKVQLAFARSEHIMGMVRKMDA